MRRQIGRQRRRRRQRIRHVRGFGRRNLGFASSGGIERGQTSHGSLCGSFGGNGRRLSGLSRLEHGGRRRRQWLVYRRLFRIRTAIQIHHGRRRRRRRFGRAIDRTNSKAAISRSSCRCSSRRGRGHFDLGFLRLRENTQRFGRFRTFIDGGSGTNDCTGIRDHRATRGNRIRDKLIEPHGRQDS